MAWDDNKMFQVKVGNFTMETGEYSFATTGTTVEVPTRLTKLVSAQVTPTEAMTAGTSELYCDKTVTTGAVTVTRVAQVDTGGSPAVTSAMTFSYTFIGV